MTTPNNLATLAARARAAKRWKPRAGMVGEVHMTRKDGRVARWAVVTSDMEHFLYREPSAKEGCWTFQLGLMMPGDTFVPDLSDPATRGCLLELVREAWGPEAHARPTLDGSWAVWTIRNGGSLFVTCATTEAGALVVALEGAP